MTNVVDRLKQFLDYSKITAQRFELAMGMSNGSFAKCVQCGSIKSERLEKVLNTYPDLSPSWLLTGHGRMLLSDYEDKKREPVDPAADPTPVGHRASSPDQGIPLIPVEAMAGALTSEQSILEYDCERYVVPVFKDADFLIQVKGSSMYPNYASGDIVACRRVALSDLFFQWGKVYVLDTNQGALIKRIKPGSKAGHILIVSDNPDYDPFELRTDTIHGIALVIGMIRLE